MTYQRFDWDYDYERYTVELREDGITCLRGNATDFMRYDAISKVYCRRAKHNGRFFVALYLESEDKLIGFSAESQGLSEDLNVEEARRAALATAEHLRIHASNIRFYNGMPPSRLKSIILYGIPFLSLGVFGVLYRDELQNASTAYYAGMVVGLVGLIASVALVLRRAPSTAEKIVVLLSRSN